MYRMPQSFHLDSTPIQNAHGSFYSVVVVKQSRKIITVPAKKMGSCLDPELLGTSLQKGADAGPGLLNLKEKSQLEPSRDEGDMRKGREKPIGDMMQEDQRPTE
jgi:hypothetical protein